MTVLPRKYKLKNFEKIGVLFSFFFLVHVSAMDSCKFYDRSKYTKAKYRYRQFFLWLWFMLFHSLTGMNQNIFIHISLAIYIISLRL